VLVAIESVITLAWVRVSFRLAPRRTLRFAIAERDGGCTPDRRVLDTFARVAAWTPIGHTCMHRALALQRMLARRGTHARLCLGTAEKPRIFPGHAWLEVAGHVINDAPELVGRYRRMSFGR
jgi:hypothetical protein